MRITLVYPPYGSGRRSRYFPFGLAYVAASLKQAGHEVTVVDMEGLDLSMEACLRDVVASRPAMVGLGGMVTRYRHVRALGRAIREALPDCFLMAGNTGATTLPELYLETCGLDAVVLGEGEETARDLAGRIESGAEWRDTPGIGFLDSGSLRLAPAREPVDLDSLPRPAWDLFPAERYINSHDHRGKLVRHMEVVASRGCPFQCVYCYRIYGRRVRRRSPASIVAEIRELVDRFGIRYTGFPDDLFTSDRDFVLETCRLMAETVPGMGWSCLARVNTVDEEMLAAMKTAGCDWVSFGIESGSPVMLDAMGRGVTVERCLEAVRMVRRAGMHADGSFMIGMYGETPETVEETVRFCREADMTAPMLFVTPYPGTAIFDRALSEGRIDDVPALLEKMDAADRLLVNLTGMSDEALEELRRKAQARIGLHYIMARPLSRIPAWILGSILHRGPAAFLRRMAALLPRLRRRRRGLDPGHRDP